MTTCQGLDLPTPRNGDFGASFFGLLGFRVLRLKVLEPVGLRASEDLEFVRVRALGLYG